MSLRVGKRFWRKLACLIIATCACDPLAGTPVYVPGHSTPSDKGEISVEYDQSVLQDQPFGYWRLSESEPTQAAADLTSGNHPGTYDPSALTDVPGPLLVDTHIEHSPSSAGSFGTPYLLTLPASVAVPSGALWAVEFWINLSSSFSSGNLKLFTWNSGSTELTYDASSQLITASVVDTSSQTSQMTLSMEANLDQWNHIAWSVTPALGGGGIQAIYLNGVLVSQTTLTQVSTQTLSQISLGGATSTSSWFMMAEMALFIGGSIPTADHWLYRYHLAGY